MIVNYWPNWFRQKYGGGWPKSYCCIDLETTGYSFAQDVVVEWGHCLVENGKVVDQLSLVVDWTDRHTPPEHWLDNQMRKCKQGMELAGKKYQHSLARMKEEGMKPEKAFDFIKKFTDTIKQKGIPFVAHNGFFDEKMLSGNFLQFKFGNGFTLGDRYIDTEGVEKATQIPNNERVHPRTNDSMRDYFTRVKYTRVTGLKSNMDEHCFTKYKLGEKYGISKNDLHGAKMDSYCCHLLMQEFGELITDPVTPPIYPTADSKAARKPPSTQTQRPIMDMSGSKRVRGQRRS